MSHIRSILASDPQTLELKYKEVETPKETILSGLVALIATVIAWPVFCLGGIISLPGHSAIYLKSHLHQSKMIKVLSDNKNLEEFDKRRIENNLKRTIHLLHDVKFLIGKLKNPNIFGTQLINADEALEDFLKLDLNTLANAEERKADQFTLTQLSRVQIQLNQLETQTQALKDAKENDRLELIRTIAEMSFVKHAFMKQRAKEWAAHSILWMLPGGFFLDISLNAPDDRLALENNKNLLQPLKNSDRYKDIVDAHNQLIAGSDYLVPYLP